MSHKGNPVRTNLAGELYRRLYRTRNAFLHGNPLTSETLTLGNGKSISYPMRGRYSGWRFPPHIFRSNFWSYRAMLTRLPWAATW